ncbi:MAG: hypothetical protein ACRYGK_06165 [Janthinobacterium lividum]
MSGELAHTAIDVHLACLAAIAFILLFHLMLMVMMAKMRRRFVFVIAIHRSRRPRILERQDEQQKEKQIFFHGANDSIACRTKEKPTTCSTMTISPDGALTFHQTLYCFFATLLKFNVIG